MFVGIPKGDKNKRAEGEYLRCLERIALPLRRRDRLGPTVLPFCRYKACYRDSTTIRSRPQ